MASWLKVAEGTLLPFMFSEVIHSALHFTPFASETSSFHRELERRAAGRFLLRPATSRLPRLLPPSDCKSVLPLARSGVKEEHGEVHIAIIPEDDELALFQRVILHEFAPAGGKECAFPVSPQLHTPFASAGAVKEDDRFGLCGWTWNVFQKLWGNPLQQIQRASKQKSKRHRGSAFR